MKKIKTITIWSTVSINGKLPIEGSYEELIAKYDGFIGPEIVKTGKTKEIEVES